MYDFWSNEESPRTRINNDPLVKYSRENVRRTQNYIEMIHDISSQLLELKSLCSNYQIKKKNDYSLPFLENKQILQLHLMKKDEIERIPEKEKNNSVQVEIEIGSNEQKANFSNQNNLEMNSRINLNFLKSRKQKRQLNNLKNSNLYPNKQVESLDKKDKNMNSENSFIFMKKNTQFQKSHLNFGNFGNESIHIKKEEQDINLKKIKIENQNQNANENENENANAKDIEKENAKAKEISQRKCLLWNINSIYSKNSKNSKNAKNFIVGLSCSKTFPKLEESKSKSIKNFFPICPEVKKMNNRDERSKNEFIPEMQTQVKWNNLSRRTKLTIPDINKNRLKTQEKSNILQKMPLTSRTIVDKVKDQGQNKNINHNNEIYKEQDTKLDYSDMLLKIVRRRKMKFSLVSNLHQKKRNTQISLEKAINIYKGFSNLDYNNRSNKCIKTRKATY